MDLMFILAQVFGVIAWFLLAISYYRENTNKILYVQLLSILFYCLNYLFLGAFTGIIVILIELVRDFSYYKTDKDDLVFLLSLPFYGILAYFARNNIIELIPIFASLFEGFTLTKKKYIVVPGAVFVYSLWVVYDMAVRSYTGAITDAIIVGSNIFIIVGYFIRLKQVENFKVISNHHIDKETFKNIYSLDKENYDKNILWDSKYQEELYKKNEDTFTLIKYKNQLIGYVNYLVIDKKKFDNILLQDELENTYDKQEILNYNINGDNYLIIDSIVINPDYESKKTVNLYTKAIKKYFASKLLKGYVIKSVIAVGVTDFEKSVLISLGFKKDKNLKHNNILYKYVMKGR